MPSKSISDRTLISKMAITSTGKHQMASVSEQFKQVPLYGSRKEEKAHLPAGLDADVAFGAVGGAAANGKVNNGQQ